MPKLTAIRRQALDEMMKEALYEAAIAVLAEHGADGLTMDRVASAAGVAKGSLYRYFGSKRDLVEFVYTKMVDPIVRAEEEIVAAEGPAMEKLARQLRMLLEHVAKHAYVYRMLFEDEVTHGLLQTSEQRTLDTASRRLAEIFRQGMSEGVFRPGDPLMLSHMYVGLTRGTLQSRPELGRCDQREEVQRVILEAFLNGIAVKKGRIG